jgi:hypothetical protein
MRLDLILVDAGCRRLVPTAEHDVGTALAHLVDLRETRRELTLALELVASVGKVLALDCLSRTAKEHSRDSETEYRGRQRLQVGA